MIERGDDARRDDTRGATPVTSSSTTTPLLDPAGATVALEQVSARIDALIAAWESPQRPPRLSDYLPDKPLEMRRLVLTELIKVDLEYRWQQHNLPKLIEEYLTEFPELADAGKLPCDLIYEEFHIRRQSPEPPDPSDYLRRFPTQAEPLKRMLNLQATEHTTTLAVGRRRPPTDIGNQIDDFDVLLRLGEGAFAAVYLAKQRSMQRLVALKVSRDHGTESQTLAQLDHQHIVRVYDQRILPAERLRLLYMQHVPGGTLQDVIQLARKTPAPERSGKTLLGAVDEALLKHDQGVPEDSSLRRRLTGLTWAETVCFIGSKLAGALDYAHRRGVLHRDVKPANVLISAEGSPKLADFNVSFSSKVDGATPAAYFGGSLAYMSPEQLEASNPDHSRQPEELDGRSDVYSLAVMLWEMLTGSRPFGEERVAANMSDTLQELAARRRAGVPQKAIDELPRDLPEGLEHILLACLAPDPADRPANGAQVEQQLQLCLQPHVRGLMRPRAGSLRQRMREIPIRVFVIAGVLPHVVFSILSIVVNYWLVIRPLGDAAEKVFRWQIATVNTFAYTLGVAQGVYLVWPVIKAMRDYQRKKPLDPAALPFLRKRSLVMGDYLTWIGFALWVISGLVFPTWLQLVGVYDPDKTDSYLYFFMSQVICGLIASTLSFFILNFVSLSGFHPLLIQEARDDMRQEIDRLMRLGGRARYYLGLAFAAPLMAILVLEFIKIPGDTDTAQLATKLATVGLVFIGLLSGTAAFFLLGRIRGDIAALAAAVDPERSSPQSGIDTIESFWSSSSRSTR